MTSVAHEPVMCAEVVRHLVSDRPRPADGAAGRPLRIVDLTLGAAGHAQALLRAAPAGSELLGIDRDERARDLAAVRLAGLGDRVHVRAARFSDLGSELTRLGWAHPDAVLADLGVSSMQLDEAERGFSFRFDASLDMRMDRAAGETAADLLARIAVDDLARLLGELGELPRAHRIARFVCEAPRPKTTTELRARILAAVGRPPRHHDPATLVFQALRIAVNDELRELGALLAALPGLLAPGARVAVLAYHSLEDRPVKQAFATWSARCICPPSRLVCACGGAPQARRLTRGAERPSEEEQLRNPRSRSARLRAIEWLGERARSEQEGRDGR